MPRAVPRQPAWTAAAAPVAGSHRSTGMQSAEKAARHTPASRVISPSASTVPGSPGKAMRSARVTRRTRSPWTCWFFTRQSGSAPMAAQKRRKFSLTRSGSSPQLPPKFRLSQGAGDTPPTRVEKPWGNPASRISGQT